MIRYRFLDRGDSGENNENEDIGIREIAETEEETAETIGSISKKVIQITSMTKPNELDDFINSKGMIIIYGSQIKDTPVDKEMNRKDFLIIYEEKDIDDEIDIDVSPEIGKFSRIESYVYKDQDGDILYFRNPYYDGDILDCMEYEYRVVRHRGEYIEQDGMLIERPEYNEAFKKKLLRNGYNHLDMTFRSIEFEEQMTGLVKLISSIGGQSVIRGAEIYR